MPKLFLIMAKAQNQPQQLRPTGELKASQGADAAATVVVCRNVTLSCHFAIYFWALIKLERSLAQEGETAIKWKIN